MFEDMLPYLPDPQTMVIILVGLVIVSYFVLYFGGRMYNRRDGFETRMKDIPVEQDNDGSKPYATTPIMKLADYDDAVELDVVAGIEGDRGASHERLNRLASAHQYDWSMQPPVAKTFQEGQAQWLLESNIVGNQTANNAVRFGGGGAGATIKESFTNPAVQPPDYDSIAAEEQRILSTYVPEKSANLSKYSADDVDDLIKRVYKARGLIPEVKEAPNGVYEVVATRPINEKVLYEDEVDANIVREGGGAEAVINVPSAAEAVAAGLDPFYEPRTSTRPGRNTYMNWTPGLERMFAPTEDKLHWY
jgi:hypothetical protein